MSKSQIITAADALLSAKDSADQAIANAAVKQANLDRAKLEMKQANTDLDAAQAAKLAAFAALSALVVADNANPSN